VANPFDREHENYFVLINSEGQHSLWPARIPIPEGWRPVREAADRADALSYVETHWDNLAPRSVIAEEAGV
jgi:MbtH protein